MISIGLYNFSIVQSLAVLNYEILNRGLELAVKLSYVLNLRELLSTRLACFIFVYYMTLVAIFNKNCQRRNAKT